MLRIAVLCLFAGCAVASYLPYYQPYAYRPAVKVIKVEKPEPPQPYEMSYSVTDEFGNVQGRQESGDAHGNKKGTYQIASIDGRRRWVQYVADENGVRAVIHTNEPGTDNQNPADVEMKVDAPKKLVVKPAAPKYKVIKVPVGYGNPGYGYGNLGYGYGGHLRPHYAPW